MECKFCGRYCKNNNSLRNHERLCHDNPNRQIIIRKKNPFIEGIKSSDALLKVRGEENFSKTHDRKCPYCDRFFTRTQIGGHVNWCRRINNSDYVVRVGEDIIDISRTELQEYMKTHPRCEICGKAVDESVRWDSKYASKRLCIDHDHSTLKFRGVLCQACNRQLGWYEKYQEEINKYLNKN